jgi:hypothetical protein
LRFELGTQNLSIVADLLAGEYERHYNDLSDPEISPVFDAEQLESEIKASTREYAVWNTRVHSVAQNYLDTSRLRALFKQVKVLKRIELAYKATPFTIRFMLESWIQGNDNEKAKIHMKQFSAVLLALQGSECQLQHLSHDQLPVAFSLWARAFY